MVKLCEYRDIFGKPGMGVHKFRIFGVAVVDLLATIILALVITFVWWRVYNRDIKITQVVGYYIVILMILILTGVFVHWLFCVDTALNKFIFE